MMGTKVRDFAPVSTVTLEEFVPAGHFYRLLERTLDLSFVRDLVANCYASSGRPSIDPVVLFKLQWRGWGRSGDGGRAPPDSRERHRMWGHVGRGVPREGV